MDYCTGFPEGWWAHCCRAHDLDYASQVGQALADERLWQCVASSGEGIGILSGLAAMVMYAGVRLFGLYYYRKANASNRPAGAGE